jgi:hypothetical protein
MNSDMNQSVNGNSTECCKEFCQTIFEVNGQQVSNSYQCNQKQFSSADMWKVNSKRRTFSFYTGL